jgi:hypothetical protein
MTHAIKHTKTAQGWAQARIAPINASTWGAADREWLDWLIEHGESVVTIGHTMYEITTPKPRTIDAEYIDLTPSWAEILPALLAVIRDGTDKGQALAVAELQRMAQAADLYNAKTK